MRRHGFGKQAKHAHLLIGIQAKRLDADLPHAVLFRQCPERRATMVGRAAKAGYDLLTVVLAGCGQHGLRFGVCLSANPSDRKACRP